MQNYFSRKNIDLSHNSKEINEIAHIYLLLSLDPMNMSEGENIVRVINKTQLLLKLEYILSEPFLIFNFIEGDTICDKIFLRTIPTSKC